MDCANCANNGNEPDEGSCAGCYRSAGIEDMWEPFEGALPVNTDYIVHDVKDEGC